MTPSLPDGAGGNREQIKYYDEGVGTGTTNRVLGFALGMGLSNNICQAEAWLARNYLEGSQLYVVGFSQGAYTALSLASLIARCSIARMPPDIAPNTAAARACGI